MGNSYRWQGQLWKGGVSHQPSRARMLLVHDQQCISAGWTSGFCGSLPWIACWGSRGGGSAPDLDLELGTARVAGDGMCFTLAGLDYSGSVTAQEFKFWRLFHSDAGHAKRSCRAPCELSLPVFCSCSFQCQIPFRFWNNSRSHTGLNFLQWNSRKLLMGVTGLVLSAMNFHCLVIGIPLKIFLHEVEFSLKFRKFK